MKLTEKDAKKLKAAFFSAVMGTAGDRQKVRGDYYRRDSEYWMLFSLNSQMGKALYRVIADEELLEMLRCTAQKLGYSPSQSEVLWIFREYVKKRFEKWPYALQKAGLGKSAGKGGKTIQKSETENRQKQKLLGQLKNKAEKNGYLPHPNQCPQLREELKKYFYTWGDALAAAGIDNSRSAGDFKYKVMESDGAYSQMLEEVKKQAVEYGRAPMHFEVDKERRRKLLKKYGSWGNVLYQVGLESAVCIRPFADYYLDYRSRTNKKKHSHNLSNYYYTVFNLTDEHKKDLEILKEQIQKTGKIPGKKEVPDQMRKRLIAVCGSWQNVLWQITRNNDWEIRNEKTTR